MFGDAVCDAPEVQIKIKRPLHISKSSCQET